MRNWMVYKTAPAKIVLVDGDVQWQPRHWYVRRNPQQPVNEAILPGAWTLNPRFAEVHTKEDAAALALVLDGGVEKRHGDR